jgi:hypothetical protein
VSILEMVEKLDESTTEFEVLEKEISEKIFFISMNGP